MDLYTENFFADMHQSLATFDYEMEMAITSLRLSDGMDSYFEATEEKQGFFSKIISAISKLFSTIINKIKSFFSGGKPSVVPGKEKETVNTKNPEGMMEFLQNDMKGSEELLKRASKGELSKEEAMNFVQKQELNWNGIKNVAITGAAALGLFGLSSKFESIRATAIGSLRDYEESNDVNGAHAVASMKDQDSKKQTAKNIAADVVSSHMQKSCNNVIGTMLNSIEQFVARGIIKSNLMEDGSALADPKRRKEKEKQLKADAKAYRANAKATQKFANARDKQAEAEDKANADRYSAKQANKAVENRVYADTHHSVDTDRVNRKDRKTVFGSSNMRNKADNFKNRFFAKKNTTPEPTAPEKEEPNDDEE